MDLNFDGDSWPYCVHRICCWPLRFAAHAIQDCIRDITRTVQMAALAIKPVNQIIMELINSSKDGTALYKNISEELTYLRASVLKPIIFMAFVTLMRSWLFGDWTCPHSQTQWTIWTWILGWLTAPDAFTAGNQQGAVLLVYGWLFAISWHLYLRCSWSHQPMQVRGKSHHLWQLLANLHSRKHSARSMVTLMNISVVITDSPSESLVNTDERLSGELVVHQPRTEITWLQPNESICYQNHDYRWFHGYREKYEHRKSQQFGFSTSPRQPPSTITGWNGYNFDAVFCPQFVLAVWKRKSACSWAFRSKNLWNMGTRPRSWICSFISSVITWNMPMTTRILVQFEKAFIRSEPHKTQA